MQNPILTISIVVGASLLVFFVERRFSSKNERQSRFDGQFHNMEYSMVERLLMYLASGLFLAFAYLAWRYPGTTDPAQVPWVIGFFIALGYFAIVMSVTRTVFKVRWNESGVSGTDALARKHSTPWTEISQVENVPWGYGLRIKSGGLIIVAPKMSGFANFMKRLDAETKERAIPWVGFPSDYFEDAEGEQETKAKDSETHNP